MGWRRGGVVCLIQYGEVEFHGQSEEEASVKMNSEVSFMMLLALVQ